jgi:hypothetical protein
MLENLHALKFVSYLTLPTKNEKDQSINKLGCFHIFLQETKSTNVVPNLVKPKNGERYKNIHFSMTCLLHIPEASKHIPCFPYMQPIAKVS